MVDLLYGRNSVSEALRVRRRRIRRLFVSDSAHALDTLVESARSSGIAVEVVPRQRLDQRVGSHHQGVVAETDQFPYSDLSEIVSASETPLVLALDSLQDPQNFGTLMRTSLAVGVDGVLIPEHRAVAVTPAVSNASAGAVEHLRIVRVTNLVRTLRDLKKQNVWVYGLSVADERAQPYWSTDLRGALALVVGSEGSGLSRLVSEACDLLLTVPMRPGSIESLNASVAGSLVLYEAFRQRAAP